MKTLVVAMVGLLAVGCAAGSDDEPDPTTTPSAKTTNSITVPGGNVTEDPVAPGDIRGRISPQLTHQRSELDPSAAQLQPQFAPIVPNR